MIYKPHAYQQRATDFVIHNRYTALFLDMGLGKTVATLTALQLLKEDYLEIDKTLVIAPKSVARNTWTGESHKWDHLKDVKVSVVMGTDAQRRKALAVEADVYVINRDNVTWLVNYCCNTLEEWPFDSVVVDESSSFKNPQSRRFKSLRKMTPMIRRMVLLTGTPSPNGLMDLWAQINLLDQGKRLGRTLTMYRQEYFRPGRHNGHVVYEWIPRPGSRERITEKISDICLSMQAEDYLEMPDLIQAGVTIALSDEEMKGYLEFEKEQLMQVDEAEIEAVTAAALTNKLLQYTGGAVYDSDHDYHLVGSSKMEALHDLVESTEEPVLVFYQYQHEKERILADFGNFSPETFNGEPEILNKWNKGEIRLLLCHPASVAYGLNMQEGGRTIIWFTPTWNLELYQQANARLYRQGQEKPVLLYHIVATGTMDERVMGALSGKGDCQSALLRRIKELKGTTKCTAKTPETPEDEM
jgi:SNF2 family DNA or RNA helicase